MWAMVGMRISENWGHALALGLYLGSKGKS